MGGFANSLFNVLMGWLRTAAVTLWQLITGQSSGDNFAWIGENWVGLVIAICVVCTVIDVVIHLIRWRPYKVWASFFRRISGQERRQYRQKQTKRQEVQPEAEMPAEEVQPSVQEWVYADGSVRQEEMLQPADTQRTSAEELAAYRSRFARPAEQAIAYRRPPEMERLQYQEIRSDSVSSAEGPAGYPKPVQEKQTPAEPEQTQHVQPSVQQETQARESLSHQMRRRMTQLQKNLGMDENEADITYRPAQPIVNKEEMYHAPVYPPNWKDQQTTQVTPRRRRQHSEINSDA